MDAWTEHMRRGDFAGAWTISDAVLRARAGQPSPPHLPRHEQWRWNGRPLAGRRVLVRCYHGLGDTVQFLRFLPWLRARAGAAEVTLWVQPALMELARTVAGIDRWMPLHDGVPEGEFDADVEIMELGHVFRVTPGTLSQVPAPYLHVEPTPPVGRSGRMAVGLVWRAGEWDERRSVPAAALAAALESLVPEVEFHLLQRGTGQRDWQAPWGTVSGADDPSVTARVMRGLDLVLTVDSLPAHLAGALGVPTWTLLHAEADWRWMTARDDSPWYPTMRLFRQEAARPGDWEPVLARVAGELKSRAAG